MLDDTDSPTSKKIIIQKRQEREKQVAEIEQNKLKKTSEIFRKK